jgi:hypothetical protein
VKLIINVINKGVHHALVFDSQDSNAPLKYLAQTDIARYLLADTTSFPHLQAILSQPVELFCTHPVLPVYLHTLLTEAIQLLVKHSALPVVNEAGVQVEGGGLVFHSLSVDVVEMCCMKKCKSSQ